jgi:polyhydroxyalkanoate synthesis repressor PhaR
MEPVLIKRYGNQRLYDTVAARYVSFDELAGMILNGEKFVVRDARTGEDITHAILDRLH